MEPQHHSRTEHSLPLLPATAPHRTANSTPVSSPGLFSPANTRSNMSLPSQPLSEGGSPATAGSPYLHPLQVQSHRIKETNKANVDTDFTGRKLINRYLVLEELGRGMHGKVKLAKNLDNEEHVAIKIVQRFSKKRKLSKITTMPTQEKSKREIAILKKIRHPNVVALLEVIDDPELKKIYMVLEHVELGEIVWRKKGIPAICNYERRRVEREMLGQEPTPEDERCRRLLERRHATKTAKRAKMARAQNDGSGGGDYWSLEYGAAEDDDASSHAQSLAGDGVAAGSGSSSGSLATPTPTTSDAVGHTSVEQDLETPVPFRVDSTTSVREGTMCGAYVEDAVPRGRSPSNADSAMSHMSSFDHNRDYSQYQNDLFADDYSYVPCFEIEVARQTFRETVLGLEYLHYEGVVHRDIKPANLLWTRDHHVKISDFGVSHFGRPIRPGEPDDTVSESEAKELDDEFELSKTVGTPAFFAPEICGFVLFDDEEKLQPRARARPKVTEQIDVWSLGVTLYCLIFARIPFLAEDEYKMWRKIAKDDVFIPKKRLRPVDPNTKPDEKSLYTRVNRAPYRDDDELSYEEIGEDLHDLLSKMLTKKPDERIRLRDVKMHPWVTHGIPNVASWLKDTDPGNSGRRIEVNEKEIGTAVVPISTLLHRAKSAVKKAVGNFRQVIPHRSERSANRRRAASSGASVARDVGMGRASVAGPSTSSPQQQQPRDGRRKSPHPHADHYFHRQQGGDHPLSQSVMASPDRTPDEHLPRPASDVWTAPVGGHSTLRRANESGNFVTNHDADEASRHSHSRSTPNAVLALTDHAYESIAGDDLGTLRKGRDMKPRPDDTSRAQSADRALFTSGDKRAGPRISVSTAVAPGNVSIPSREGTPVATSPLSPGAGALAGYRHGQYRSVPNMQRGTVDMKQRPNHVLEAADADAAAAAAAAVAAAVAAAADASDAACPPSPGNDDNDVCLSQPSRQASRQGTSSTSMGGGTTPLTSPSETADAMCEPPLAFTSRNASDGILTFQSDPSLPALTCGASEPSADEGELLDSPGVVDDTNDSLTPPAPVKETANREVRDGAVTVAAELDDDGASQPSPAPTSSAASTRGHDGDSDSDDEGLTMAKLKKRSSRESSHGGLGLHCSRRRNTNASIASTDTAKKIFVDDEGPHPTT